MDNEERDSLRRWRWFYVPAVVFCSALSVFGWGGVAYGLIVDRKWYENLAFMSVLWSAGAIYCAKCIRHGTKK
jgi:hypothetical protein